MCEADGRPTASAGAISRAVMPSRLWHCSTARRPAKSSESCRRCAGGSPLARGVGSLWQPLSGGAYERPGWGADPKPVLPFRIAVELALFPEKAPSNRAQQVPTADLSPPSCSRL